MTKKELMQLQYLKKEIERDAQRLAELESSAANTTQKITGMPFCSETSDKVGNFAVQIAEQKRLIEKKLKRCMELQNQIVSYINSIDDSLIRLIMTYRYIYSCTWCKTAMKIGGGNSADSVRMAHNRFLNSQKSCGENRLS